MKASQVGLVECWDADYGVGRVGTVVTEWIGLRGNVLSPIDPTIVLETTRFSGRSALGFNGTSSGMRAQLSQFRRCGQDVSLAIQYVAADNTTTPRSLAELSADGSSKLIWLYHPGTANHVTVAGDGDALSYNSTTGWAVTETVLQDDRLYHSGVLSEARLYYNGGLRSIGADTRTFPQPLAEDLIVGHTSAAGSPAYFFSGSIRRILVYCAEQAAAPLDAQYRGS